jgi:hypothetical protein
MDHKMSAALHKVLKGKDPGENISLLEHKAKGAREFLEERFDHVETLWNAEYKQVNRKAFKNELNLAQKRREKREIQHEENEFHELAQEKATIEEKDSPEALFGVHQTEERATDRSRGARSPDPCLSSRSPQPDPKAQTAPLLFKVASSVPPRMQFKSTKEIKGAQNFRHLDFSGNISHLPPKKLRKEENSCNDKLNSLKSLKDVEGASQRPRVCSRKLLEQPGHKTSNESNLCRPFPSFISKGLVSPNHQNVEEKAKEKRSSNDFFHKFAHDVTTNPQRPPTEKPIPSLPRPTQAAISTLPQATTSGLTYQEIKTMQENQNIDKKMGGYFKIELDMILENLGAQAKDLTLPVLEERVRSCLQTIQRQEATGHQKEGVNKPATFGESTGPLGIRLRSTYTPLNAGALGGRKYRLLRNTPRQHSEPKICLVQNTCSTPHTSNPLFPNDSQRCTLSNVQKHAKQPSDSEILANLNRLVMRQTNLKTSLSKSAFQVDAKTSQIIKDLGQVFKLTAADLPQPQGGLTRFQQGKKREPRQKESQKAQKDP